MEYKKLIKLSISEMLATAILIFICCLGCVKTDFYTPTLISIAFIVALDVILVLNIFIKISGAHINPAITLAAFVYKLIDFKTLIIYITSQLFGSFLGYSLVRLVTPLEVLGNDSNQFCVLTPSVENFKAFWVEFFLTMALVLLCCVMWDPKNGNTAESVPIKLGMAVAVLVFVGAPISGGSMNPARNFGPALYNLKFKSQWVYWAGPMLSAIITSITFRSLFYKEEQKEKKILLKIPEERPLKGLKTVV